MRDWWSWARVRRDPLLNPLFSTRTPSLFHSQDPTVHPRWTGDDSANASEDGRLARFARKCEGGLGEGGGGKGAGGGS